MTGRVLCSSLLLGKGLCAAATLSGALTLSSLAAAQEASAENKAAARDLGLAGIRLAQQGKCQEALAPLSRAQKLFPAPTIVTWVGRCQIEVGRFVEGTETLHQVVRQKLGDDAPQAYLQAQQEARALLAITKPKIAKLVIQVAGPHGAMRATQDVQVQVDGAAVASALIGAPRPTDPGTHLIEVRAKGHLPQQREVTLEQGENEEVTITLKATPKTSPTTPVAIVPVREDSEIAAMSAQARPRNTGLMPSLGWGFVGGGGLLLAGGGAMGIWALSSKSTLDCADKICPKDQEKELQRARTRATLSTVFFSVGGAALVTGVVLLVTGRSPSSESALLEYQLNSVRVRPDWGWGSIGLNGQF